MKRILLDLDTLLDTRLGCLSLIYPEAATYVVKHTDYWDREHTDWSKLTDGRVTNAQFEERWAKRDIDVLQNSVLTSINVVLLRILSEMNINATTGVTVHEVGLEVNLAPYTLSFEEQEELEQILRETYGQELVITFCSIPVAELTPTYIRKRYAAVLLYGFHEWIKIHDAELMKGRSPDIYFIGPKLFEKDPSRLSIEQKQEEYRRFRFFKLEYMDFEFVDAKFFSMYRPEKPKAA